jgi:hypothetical protein
MEIQKYHINEQDLQEIRGILRGVKKLIGKKKVKAPTSKRTKEEWKLYHSRQKAKMAGKQQKIEDRTIADIQRGNPGKVITKKDLATHDTRGYTRSLSASVDMSKYINQLIKESK